MLLERGSNGWRVSDCGKCDDVGCCSVDMSWQAPWKRLRLVTATDV